MSKKYYYKKGDSQTCFMCDAPATTGDHIPPKGLFTTSIRSQRDYSPLQVPACKKHNDISKKDDEYLRLVMAAGSPQNESAKKLFTERIIPHAEKSERSGFLMNLYKQMIPKLIKNPSGILTYGYQYKINKPRVQNVMNKIARGLYWHHNGVRLPEECTVSHYSYNRKLSENQMKAICLFPIFSVGHPSVFEYRYIEEAGDTNNVYIAIMIYESLLFEVAINGSTHIEATGDKPGLVLT
jgi:hypothetical protein